MGDLNNFVGALGGTILCIELTVLLLLGVAANAGLAFGLWWVLRHTIVVREKIHWATGKGQRVLDTSMSIAAAPVIRTTSVWRGLKAGLHRAIHWPAAPAANEATAEKARPSEPEPAARPSRAA